MGSDARRLLAGLISFISTAWAKSESEVVSK